MANAKRSLATAAAAVVAASWLTPGPARAGEAPGPAVVLRVENYAGVPAALLAGAEEEATAIYAAAGIRALWTNDAADPDPEASAAHATVLLLTRDMSERKIRADDVGTGVMGQAARPTRRAYIFYFRIADVASREEVFGCDLLAKVIAHEVGHLLLPAPGHSSRGIMRAELELSPTVIPHFTPEQAEAMRHALAEARNAS